MSYDGGNYDVIVIGAGHAGCEAALAAARMGCSTLMITIKPGYGCIHALQSVHRRTCQRTCSA